MKKTTPVIMGVLLIIGIVALGYFADLENTTNGNNSTNNTTKYPFFKQNNFTNPQSSADQTQISSDTTSNTNTDQNATNITTQNSTVSATSNQ
jgi:hypothetical protein